ncbi:MAG: hypothetical protein GXZ13_02615 [Synergistaceae bacterium]|nr:hypothetical protein [Synergistaceae bacterium]
MRYIVFLPITFFIFIGTHNIWLITLIITTSIVFIGGLVYRSQGIKEWKNPWLIAGWSSFTLLLTIASVSRDFWNTLSFDGYHSEPAALLLLGTLIIFFVVGVILTVQKWTPLKLMVMAFPLLALFKYFGFIGYVPMFWITNVYFAVLGIMTLLYGMRNRELLEMNAGMLQLVLLISSKFFDSGISIIGRAIVFIIIGLIFIAANIYLGRYFKKTEDKLLTEKKNG